MTAETMKQAVRKASRTGKGRTEKLTSKLTATAQETLAKKVATFRSTAQVLGEFAEKVETEKRKEFLADVDDLIEAFGHETESKITIGQKLRDIRDLLGQMWDGFLDSFVTNQLRKSRTTCFVYMGISSAFSVEFGRNPVVRMHLSRIWGAEGCYDEKNGTLKPVVQDAIDLCGGIPESKDPQTCDIWAHKFVTVVDTLVTKARKARVKGDMDAETMKKTADSIVSRYSKFIVNGAVSDKRVMALATEILMVTVTSGALKIGDLQIVLQRAIVEIKRKELQARKANAEIAERTAELPPTLNDKQQQEIARTA